MNKHARRVRALLAKADSTTFPAEALELRRKASELMSRHGLTPTDLAERSEHRPAVVRPHAPVFVRIVYSSSTSGGFGFGNGTTTGYMTWNT